jgi:5-methylcytosine-specific restriction endonuclease McrA
MPHAAPENQYTCALCERQVGYVTLHHLIPKQEGGRYGDRVPLCQPCHVTLHSLFTNKRVF